jgi:5-oxoprolinase (ATP-hydrolysing)/N-methylhydantoinase A
MIEIGGGGGSIASISEVGLLRVGPASAGSSPGPACYGLGGREPTVTDANLALGYYDPNFFLGGKMRLDRDAARASLVPIGKRLGLGIEATAQGIHQLVSENMAAAIREHAIERGVDPRAHALVAFGGAGPAHAATVARILNVGEVVIPPASGAASALGFLAAPLSFEASLSLPMVLDPQWRPAELEAAFAALERAARAHLRQGGVADADIVTERRAEMRLVGQMHEILVDLPDQKLEADVLDEIRRRFEAVYRRQYTMVPEGARIELINLRSTCRGPAPEVTVNGTGTAAGTTSVKGQRDVWTGAAWAPATVYDRYGLRVGDHIDGPAIIEEREATTVIHRGDSLTVDTAHNLRIKVAGTRARRRAGSRNFAAAVAEIEADPIGLEIMWSRLAAISEEMWLTVCRTAYSLIVSEAQDFACELLDGKGETLAHSRRGMPVFNLTLPRAVKALLEVYPSETLRPGDVLVTNDPWFCAGHLPDIAVVTPIFHKGKLVGLSGTIGHVSDIGGIKDSLAAREIYDEGFQIPPLKLFNADVRDETLVRLLGNNVRGGEQVIGDLLSFVSANATGAERLLGLMDEYGLDELAPLASILQSRSERAMREAIAAVPDGTYSAETWANPLGTPYRLPLRLTVAGDEIKLDFEGAPKQLPRGGLNCTLSYTEAHATYPLKCILTPNVRGNAGCYRPFTVSAPKGSVLNAERPASVNIRTRTGWYIGPSVYRALSACLPDRVQAFTGLPMSLTVYGRGGDGFYSDVFLLGGGQGASAGSDGISGLIFPSSAANTSIELFESRVPVVVGEKTLLSDTGGPGRLRGGLAQRITIGRHPRLVHPVFISVFPESVGIEMAGLFGGGPGQGASGRLIRADGSVVRDCGTGELVELAEDGLRLEAILTGGSGFGPVEERSPAAVRHDLDEGLVTELGVRRDYAPAIAGRSIERVANEL